jgi:hypothetical protein
MSSPGSPWINITRTGEKFPPHGYNPSALPGSEVPEPLIDCELIFYSESIYQLLADYVI